MAAPLHESPENLTSDVLEMRRALQSLIEELEAIDWYSQRISASADADLRRVLTHNRDEEKEHACMTLEWIRRKDPIFDAHLRTHLFRPQSADLGEEIEPDGDAGAVTPSGRDVTLGIGSLRAGARTA
jgi:ferritin-like protein